MGYKKSYYNIWSNTNDGKHIIYNTLADSISIVDDSLKENILNNRFSSIDDTVLNSLLMEGVIVDEKIDELEVYNYELEKQKYSNDLFHCMITTTLNCNCNCKYCFQQDIEKTSNERSFYKPIRKFITSEVQRNNIKETLIDFFGGEPFLEWKYIQEEISYYIKNIKKVKFRFYTNGTLLDDEKIHYLKSNKKYIKDLQITLDGIKEIHDSLRPLKNGKSCYDEIVSNLKKLKENDIKYVIRINFDIKSYKSIENLLVELEKNNLKDSSIAFYPVQAMTSGCSHYKDAVDNKEIVRIMIELTKLAYDKGFKISLRPNKSLVYCTASCNNSYIINTKLEVYKCALLQENKKFIIGKISEDGNLYNKTKEFYNWMSKNPSKINKCSKCTLLPLCGGGCSGSAIGKYGTYECANCYDMSVSYIKERVKLYYLKRYKGE
ncbi:radical SAM/SPASM domain-containing protein [Clostridium perfringens]|uniref:radical SAM/SPASM domain-containing protein n=1 Tax=Clostridium perfringens TaxID=1502 RepID=UPI0018E3FD7D|nr:radical SAM protein [Clostridium perfringens]MBI6039877.1 radical SAM protein [Clostridium perfringens]